jgi:hypothetical protein
MTITKGDLLGMLDVLTELVNDCDSLAVDEALALHELLDQVGSELKRAGAALDIAVKDHLEAGAKQIEGKLYALGEDGVWRYRHDDIARAIKVRALAIDETTGEMRSAEEAVTEALDLFALAYVSPSTRAKKAALELLGFPEGRAARWERTGKKIVVTDLGPPEGAE